VTENSETSIKVGIIGLGYVGLPLATAFADAGVDVLGIDVAQDKVEAVSAGHSYIEDVSSDELTRLTASGRLSTSTDPAGLADCSAVLICLPTPLTEHREPDLGFVLAGTETALRYLAPGALLVLESTTWPGTTREVLAPMVEASGRTIGTDAFLAFSPQRVDPGNAKWGIRETPKVVGGMTDACSEHARALYDTICDTVHVVSSPEPAEMAKIIENTYRAVNIALVNEMAILADRMDIDIWEAIDAAAIDAAATKPLPSNVDVL
jgi:UDP-N-acetyl-D-glucosamine dehydrogenase